MLLFNTFTAFTSQLVFLSDKSAYIFTTEFSFK